MPVIGPENFHLLVAVGVVVLAVELAAVAGLLVWIAVKR